MTQGAEEMQVVKYDITDAAIAKMRDLYMDLVITDLDDKEQFQSVRDARLVVKKHRVAVDKKCKELKAPAIAFQREANGEAKRIKGLLEPIETHLQTEENKVIEEQERIAAEEKRKEQEKIQKRVDDLQKVNCTMSYLSIAAMTDEEYSDLYQGKYQEFEVEQVRIAEEKRLEDERKKQEEIKLAEERVKQAEEAERLKAENERLEKIRLEQEAKQKVESDRLAKIQADLDAQAKVIQDEKNRIAKAEADKKAAEAAKIQAAKDEKERVEREAHEAEELKIKEDEEKAMIEALRPDREKLFKFAEFLQDDIPYPEVTSKEAKAILKKATIEIYDIANKLFVWCDEL